MILTSTTEKSDDKKRKRSNAKVAHQLQHLQYWLARSPVLIKWLESYTLPMQRHKLHMRARDPFRQFLQSPNDVKGTLPEQKAAPETWSLDGIGF